MTRHFKRNSDEDGVMSDEQVAAYGHLVRDMFDIDDQQITLVVVNAPDGDASYRGMTWNDPVYWKSRIEIERNLGTAEGKRTVLHEMLHAVMIRMDQSVLHQIIDAEVPPERRDVAKQRYREGLEYTIERITRALYRTLPPPIGICDDDAWEVETEATDDAVRHAD